jgi:hypothetical protein
MMRLGIVLIPLVAPAVMLPLAACDHKDFTESADRVEAVLRGDPPPDAGMYMAELPASSEEAVAAAATVDDDSSAIVEQWQADTSIGWYSIRPGSDPDFAADLFLSTNPVASYATADAAKAAAQADYEQRIMSALDQGEPK